VSVPSERPPETPPTPTLRPRSVSALSRPRWTLTEAAQRVQVSRSTLRRRLEGGAFPGAVQDDSGAWTVTVEDLLGAGFTLARPVVEEPVAGTLKGSPSERAHPAESQAHERAQVDEDLAQRVAQLERDLERERAQRALEHAQRVAAEREVVRLDANLGDLRQALRMLEAGPRPMPAAELEPVVQVVDQVDDVTPADDVEDAQVVDDVPPAPSPVVDLQPAGPPRGRLRSWLRARL
jgi:hypothetical protein